MIDRGHWARLLLPKLGVPVSRHNRYAIVAWASAEGTAAKFNPLATTKPMTGSTLFNQTGVRNYKTLEDGLNATSLTLREGGHGYGAIIQSLADNNAATETLKAVKNSEWGTGALALEVLHDVKREYETFASRPIGQ